MKAILIMLIGMVAMASAASVKEKILINLLERLLSPVKRGYCDDNADTVECNGGKCGGGENPHEWEKGNYYCYKCPVPTGGWQCEFEDPCGTKPCASEAEKTICKPSASTPINNGYYCKKPRSTSVRDVLIENMDEHGDLEPYKQIRAMMFHNGGDLEAAVGTVKTERLLNED